MSHVYWERSEIPIPIGAHVNKNDGRVFLLTKIGHLQYRRDVIGRATSDLHMHPNSLFRSLFPDLWTQYYGSDSIIANELCCGLYAVSLSIAHKTGLYDVLIRVFGPKYANAILDFSIYSIKYNSNVAETFCEK